MEKRWKLIKDNKFLEDKLWHEQNKAYNKFLNDHKNKKLLLLEFGVGFNTPGIIRFPFEGMTKENSNWTLVRFNKDTRTYYSIDSNRFIGINKDINKIINELEDNYE